MIQALNIKILDEINRINIAYDKSKSGGLFGRRDKKWINLLKDNNNLMINVLVNALNNVENNNEKLVLSALAYGVTSVMENAFVSHGDFSGKLLYKISSVQRDKRLKLKALARKELKLFDEKVYKQILKQEFIFCPFVPAEVEQDFK